LLRYPIPAGAGRPRDHLLPLACQFVVENVAIHFADEIFLRLSLEGLNEEETTNAQIDIRSCVNGGAIFGWISDHGC
jgi:hypothetical protein